MRWSSPYGTQSRGVVRGTPDLRPLTVNMRLGRPAMRRMDQFPSVTPWICLSSHVIWGSSFGIHEMAPILMANGVNAPMERDSKSGHVERSVRLGLLARSWAARSLEPPLVVVAGAESVRLNEQHRDSSYHRGDDAPAVDSEGHH